MHLAGFMHSSHVVLSHAIWRHPETQLGFLNHEFYQAIAQVLERGKFDLVFFADALALPDQHGGSPAVGLTYGAQGAVRLDPVLVATAMAVSTQRIGVGITRSTTYYQPYDVARIFGTLDHLSKGRAAWNVVTSARAAEAQNFGIEQHLEHDRRYDRADEFVEVVNKLWQSWEPDALVLDKESGIFADPARVNYVDHHGEWFQVRGPLTVPRSPQGRPVIIQAGSSARGLDFAARWGEVIFEINHTPAQIKAFYQQIKARVAQYGRNSSACKVLTTITPFIGETEAIARTLASAPKVILMDEPFGALDALTRESMQDHLKRIWQQTRKTIFFITHDIEEALLLSTRIIVMHARPGRIVHDLVNPFANRSVNDSTSNLRLSREFVEMREYLVRSIHSDPSVITETT